MEMHEMKDLDGGRGQHSGASIEQYRKKLLIDEIPEYSWEPTSDCCIYRVPKHLRKINEEAYTPQLISIGPLHHGKLELADLEKQKIRYMREFRKRIIITRDKWQALESYVRENMRSISNCYAEILYNFENDDDFARMVLLDAVFIIEFLLKMFHNQNDYLVRTLWLKRAIATDLCLLENQLPFYILNDLYKLAFSDGGMSLVPFLTLCCTQFTRSRSTSTIPEGVKIKHFTDLRRYNVLNLKRLKQKARKFVRIHLPSAVKLHESGLKFKPIAPLSFSDIEFKRKKLLLPFFEASELHMPYLLISDDSEYLYRNIMALEQCHYPLETHFCNYINLLDELINTEKDVDLLIDEGILICDMGDHAALAAMVNKLCTNIHHFGFSFGNVAEDLREHYRNPWNHAQAKLLSVYFCNPWRGTATVAAIILLLLTLAQTITSIMSV